MKVNEIRELTPEELALKLSELKAELLTFRFQNATNQLTIRSNCRCKEEHRKSEDDNPRTRVILIG